MNVYDKIVIENKQKKEKIWKSKKSLHKSSSKKWLRNGIRSLIMRTDVGSL